MYIYIPTYVFIYGFPHQVGTSAGALNASTLTPADKSADNVVNRPNPLILTCTPLYDGNLVVGESETFI